jgi:hypothetical protein
MQHIFFTADYDSMARIVAALVSGYNIRFLSKEIDNLALTLVAPLGPYYHNC